MPAPKKVSKKLVDFLASWEGEKLKAYKVEGEDFWTIGVGHTGKVDGKVITGKTTITQAKSRQLLKKDLAKFEKLVLEHIPEGWRDEQHEFDTFVSLAFNMGEEILTPEPPLTTFATTVHRKQPTKRNKRLAGNHILLYNKGGQPLRVMPGLVRRRKAERKLFLTGVYDHND